MTAEIAILNKRGIALAADSAVTVEFDGGYKVFQSADKLFTLSKYHPVGVMIFNSAEMLGVPWETAVKSYRSELAHRSHSTVSDYARDFLAFLENHSGLYPDQLKSDFASVEISAVFHDLKEAIVREINRASPGKAYHDVDDPRELITNIINANYRRAKAMPLFQLEDGKSWSDEVIREVEKSHLPIIRSIRDKLFGEFELNANQNKLLTEIGKSSLTRSVGASGYTGVVVAGYGDSEYYPSLTSFEIYGNLNGRLRYQWIKEKSVSIKSGSEAAIVPFAQSEMVTTFMEGVDPSYAVTIDRAFSAALSSTVEALTDAMSTKSQIQLPSGFKDKLVQGVADELSESLRHERWKNFVQPVLSVVGAWPKTELASMAESLVNLTSMKRHASSGSETVGGPIDVALISKGDGFVWIKRKHYFDKDLNYHFFANYFRGGKDHEV